MEEVVWRSTDGLTAWNEKLYSAFRKSRCFTPPSLGHKWPINHLSGDIKGCGSELYNDCRVVTFCSILMVDGICVCIVRLCIPYVDYYGILFYSPRSAPYSLCTFIIANWPCFPLICSLSQRYPSSVTVNKSKIDLGIHVSSVQSLIGSQLISFITIFSFVQFACAMCICGSIAPVLVTAAYLVPLCIILAGVLLLGF